MLLFLIIFFTTMTLFSYYKMGKELISPSIIFSGMYTISIFIAWLNRDNWGINYSISAFLVLLMGGIEFVLIGYFISYLFEKKDIKKEFKKKCKFEVIKNKTVVISFILTVYSIIVVIVLLKNVLDLASQFGDYASLSEALGIYRSRTSYTLQASLPSYVTILQKPLIAGAYINSYLLISDIVSIGLFKKNKFWKRIVVAAPIVMYCVMRLAESSRGPILNLLFGCIFLYFFSWYKKNNWERSFPLKGIVFMIFFLLIGVLAFYLSASLIGRTGFTSLSSYISTYFGGSIETFNRFMIDRPQNKGIFGEETFYHLIADLDRLGITNYSITSFRNAHLEYVYNGDVFIGNVFTAYRRWIYDFGLGGAFVLQGIMAVAFNYSYFHIKRLSLYGIVASSRTVFYSYFVYCVFNHIIDGNFYLETFSYSTVGTLLVLAFMCFCYFHVSYYCKEQL